MEVGEPWKDTGLTSGNCLKNGSRLSGPLKLDTMSEIDKDFELPGLPKNHIGDNYFVVY